MPVAGRGRDRVVGAQRRRHHGDRRAGLARGPRPGGRSGRAHGPQRRRGRGRGALPRARRRLPGPRPHRGGHPLGGVGALRVPRAHHHRRRRGRSSAGEAFPALRCPRRGRATLRGGGRRSARPVGVPFGQGTGSRSLRMGGECRSHCAGIARGHAARPSARAGRGRTRGGRRAHAHPAGRPAHDSSGPARGTGPHPGGVCGLLADRRMPPLRRACALRALLGASDDERRRGGVVCLVWARPRLLAVPALLGAGAARRARGFLAHGRGDRTHAARGLGP